MCMTKQRGMTLIEVLIAVVVLSIGLLGVAALQINALRANESALQRSQAVMLAYLAFDAMRANQQQAQLAAYNTDGLLCVPLETVETLAQRDLEFWLQAIKGALGDSPESCGSIACTSDASGVDCTVQIQWNDSLAIDAANAERLSMATRL